MLASVDWMYSRSCLWPLNLLPHLQHPSLTPVLKATPFPPWTRNCATLEISLPGLCPTLPILARPPAQQTCRAYQAALCHPFLLSLGTSTDSSSFPTLCSSTLVMAETQASTSNPCHSILPTPLTNFQIWEKKPFSSHTRLRAPWSKASFWVISIGPVSSRVSGIQAALNYAYCRRLTIPSDSTTGLPSKVIFKTILIT